MESLAVGVGRQVNGSAVQWCYQAAASAARWCNTRHTVRGMASQEAREEQEALRAILGEEAVHTSLDGLTGRLEVTVELPTSLEVSCPGEADLASVLHLPPVQLQFSLSPNYPADGQAELVAVANWLPVGLVREVEQALTRLREEVGEVVLYQAVSTLQDVFGGLAGKKLKLPSLQAWHSVLTADQAATRAKFNRSLQQCGVCLTDLLGSQMAELDCPHSFCRACLGRHCEAEIELGRGRQVPCPAHDCRQPLTMALVQQLVSQTAWQRYDAGLLTRAMRSLSNTVWCPVLDCQQPASVLNPGLAKCPVCSFVFCTECQRAFHGNSCCEDHSVLRSERQQREVEQEAEQEAGRDGGTSRQGGNAELAGDMELFHALEAKRGRRAAEDELRRVVSALFGGLDAAERAALVREYTTATLERRQQLQDQYGRPFLHYFLASQLGGRARRESFTEFLRELREDRGEGPRLQLLINTAAVRALAVDLILQPCPACSVPIEKTGGCHHMYCTQCGSHFCWDCLQDMQLCTQTRCDGRY